MAAFAYKTSGHISERASEKLAHLNAFPALETFQNPVTRGIARRLVNDFYERHLRSIDFDYRLNDVDINGVACVHYETSARPVEDMSIIYIHGGGFVTGSPRSLASVILPVSMLSRVDAIGIQYSLAPEARFPTPLDEIDKVYRSILERKPGQKVFIVADSTGCALALGCVMRWRDIGVTAPAGIVLMSPMIDAKALSDTHITHKDLDPYWQGENAKTRRRMFDFFAPGEAIDNPHLSPLYGNFDWAPPLLVQVGTREVCLGEAARLTEKAALAGVEAQLRVFDGMFHLFQMDWALDEAKRAHQQVANFIAAHRD